MSWPKKQDVGDAGQTGTSGAGGSLVMYCKCFSTVLCVSTEQVIGSNVHFKLIVPIRDCMGTLKLLFIYLFTNVQIISNVVKITNFETDPVQTEENYAALLNNAFLHW